MNAFNITRMGCLGLLAAALLMAGAGVVRGQDYQYATNADGTITITKYTGSGDYVRIPSTINDLRVTSIGAQAFLATRLTAVTIPNCITNIGSSAFCTCTELTNVTIGNGVMGIEDGAFQYTSLTNITIPECVVSIGRSAFHNCLKLIAVYFKGNTPRLGSDVFKGDTKATIYYLPGTTGWGSTFAGRPTREWKQ